MPEEAFLHEDKHKAPTRPRILPLSLQDGATSFPVSVVTIHQNSNDRERSC